MIFERFPGFAMPEIKVKPKEAEMPKALKDYTEDQIKNISASPETDFLVASVLGHVERRWNGERMADFALPYSTDMRAAWPIAEANQFIIAPEWDDSKDDFMPDDSDRPQLGFGVELSGKMFVEHWRDDIHSFAVADTAPLAIVRAFLLLRKAKG